MASVINPDGELYIINGDVKITGEIIAGDGVGSDTLRISSINDLDLSGFPVNLPADYDSADAALNVKGGSWIGGHLYVGGTLIANGDLISLGNSGGSLTFNSNISSNLLPSSTNIYDIGNSTEYWRRGIFSQLVVSPDPGVVQALDTFVPVDQTVSHISSTSNASLTMADGTTPGQTKVILAVQTPASPVTITPASPVGFSYFTLTNAGDSITLIYTTSGWVITSAFRTNVTN